MTDPSPSTPPADAKVWVKCDCLPHRCHHLERGYFVPAPAAPTPPVESGERGDLAALYRTVDAITPLPAGLIAHAEAQWAAGRSIVMQPAALIALARLAAATPAPEEGPASDPWAAVRALPEWGALVRRVSAPMTPDQGAARRWSNDITHAAICLVAVIVPEARAVLAADGGTD